MEDWEKIYKYIRLKSLSLVRLWREIPFVYQVVMLAVISLAIYALIQFRVPVSVKSLSVGLCVFVLAGVPICSFSFPEKILLKSLGLKLFPLFMIRCFLLSVPFFILNVYFGLVMVTVGLICVYFLSKVNFRSGKGFPSFYKKTSYQWLSGYRTGGVWALISGFLFFAVALYHKNENMSCVAFGWLMCVPCFVSYYTKMLDARIWLVNYRSASFLLRCKLIELLVNALLPALICLPALMIFMPAYILLFIRLLFVFLFIDMLFLYSYYLCYPSMIMSGLCCILLVMIWSVITWMHPVISVYMSAPLLLLLHILTIQNLKSIRHAELTS
ncbi:MAG: hypothetical protein LBV74_13205 [Tannerella sp.]|jgi:hypothetical protein|nr:hypothetical protein [Tannerella sp.]